MDLLGVEFGGLAGLHQLGHVVESRRPVESTSECLADEGSQGRVVPAVPAVYIGYQLSPLFPGDTTQGNIIRPLPV